MSVFRWLTRGTVPAARYLNSCPKPCGKALGENWNVNDQNNLTQIEGRDLNK